MLRVESAAQCQLCTHTHAELTVRSFTSTASIVLASSNNSQRTHALAPLLGGLVERDDVEVLLVLQLLQKQRVDVVLCEVTCSTRSIPATLTSGRAAAMAKDRSTTSVTADSGTVPNSRRDPLPSQLQWVRVDARLTKMRTGCAPSTP